MPTDNAATRFNEKISQAVGKSPYPSLQETRNITRQMNDIWENNNRDEAEGELFVLVTNDLQSRAKQVLSQFPAIKDHLDADDLIQLCWLEIRKRLCSYQFRDRGHFFANVFRLFVWRVLTLVEKVKNETTAKEKLSQKEKGPHRGPGGRRTKVTPANSEGPQIKEAEKHEEIERILHALLKLEEPHQTVFGLRHFGQRYLEYKEKKKGEQNDEPQRRAELESDLEPFQAIADCLKMSRTRAWEIYEQACEMIDKEITRASQEMTR